MLRHALPTGVTLMVDVAVTAIDIAARSHLQKYGVEPHTVLAVWEKASDCGDCVRGRNRQLRISHWLRRSAPPPRGAVARRYRVVSHSRSYPQTKILEWCWLWPDQG